MNTKSPQAPVQGSVSLDVDRTNVHTPSNDREPTLRPLDAEDPGALYALSVQLSPISLDGDGNDIPKVTSNKKGKCRADPIPSEDLHAEDRAPPQERWTFRTVVEELTEAVDHHRARRSPIPPELRVHEELNTPTKFINATFRLMACEPNEPQVPEVSDGMLLEDFNDTDRWAREVLRTKYGLQEGIHFDDDVVILLMILVNTFYENNISMIHEMISVALHAQDARNSARLQVEHFIFPYEQNIQYHAKALQYKRIHDSFEAMRKNLPPSFTEGSSTHGRSHGRVTRQPNIQMAHKGGTTKTSAPVTAGPSSAPESSVHKSTKVCSSCKQPLPNIQESGERNPAPVRPRSTTATPAARRVMSQRSTARSSNPPRTTPIKRQTTGSNQRNTDNVPKAIGGSNRRKVSAIPDSNRECTPRSQVTQPKARTGSISGASEGTLVQASEPGSPRLTIRLPPSAPTSDKHPRTPGRQTPIKVEEESPRIPTESEVTMTITNPYVTTPTPAVNNLDPNPNQLRSVQKRNRPWR